MNVGLHLFIFACNFLSLIFFKLEGKQIKPQSLLFMQSNEADLVLLMWDCVLGKAHKDKCFLAVQFRKAL